MGGPNDETVLLTEIKSLFQAHETAGMGNLEQHQAATTNSIGGCCLAAKMSAGAFGFRSQDVGRCFWISWPVRELSLISIEE